MIGRIFRIVRVPITLLVLLGVLCYGAWWGYSNVIQAIPPAPPSPCVNQPVKNNQLRSSQVTVSVFNGGDKLGLAGDVGRSLRERGFRVLDTSNLDGERIAETVIVGSNAKNPEVLLVKSFFKKAKFRADKRLLDRSVHVLVGDKYGGFNQKAKNTIAVKGRAVCLPAPPSQSAAFQLAVHS